MSADRWQRVELLYHAALELGPEARAAFLAEDCADDAELRREVAALLACDERAVGFLESPALELAAKSLACEGLAEERESRPAGAGRSTDLAAGTRLGPYEVVAPVGAGGMGEVYRARDTRLGREVALKVISPRMVGDPSNRRRFEREARAASILNHPSIVTVYDVGESGSAPWIAMEWVEGRTLRQVFSEGPLPLGDAVSIARQIADGLTAAHAKGIVHRDLKPENVVLAADGRIKVLDFGLARQTLGEGPEPISLVETLAAPPSDATGEGTILGTVGYMSPEQASGRPVDFRSDQFAFGLLTYEMVTGRRVFARSTVVETLSAVIREEPVPVSSIRDDVPLSFQRVIATCLAKRPEDRFASTRDLAAALAVLETGSSAAPGGATETQIVPPPEGPRPGPSRRPALIVLAALGLALTAAGWMTFYAPRAAVDSLAVLPFENASRDSDAEYLSDGLTESLINQMSRVPSLKVQARATVFRFKGVADAQEAGRKLGVGAVLTGSVARRGDRISITAELVETSTGVRLWGEKYDRPLADLLRVQDLIASDISDGLRLRLSGPERATLGRHSTEDPEAYDLALKAGFFLRKETEEGDLEARQLYRQALERDPNLVEALVGVATTYARSAVSGWERPTEAWPLAHEQLQRALALDPGNVMARCALANRHFYFDWDWARSEREYRELSDDPRLFLGEQWRVIPLSFWARGQTEEALSLMEKALRADPGALNSRRTMADFLARAGRLEEAVGYYRAGIEAEPSDPGPLFGLAEVLKRRGEVKGAIDALRKAYELSAEEPGVRALATANTESDYETAELAVARMRLADLEALAKERYVSPLDPARLHAQVGEREKAFVSLEAALAERSSGLVFLKVDGAWDRIRDDARFATLVRRVGIP